MARPKKPAAPVLQADFAELAQERIRALGDYEHVTVHFRRGHGVVESDGYPVARLTPIGTGLYGLSFRTHQGRWEKMPWSGPLAEIVEVLVTTLGPYLARAEFPDRNNGSDH